MTLDEWLSKIYTADLQGHYKLMFDQFYTALENDKELLNAATSRFAELHKIMEARGSRACAFSYKYYDYLKEALL